MAAFYGRPSTSENSGKSTINQGIEVLDLTGEDNPQPLSSDSATPRSSAPSRSAPPSKPSRAPRLERPESRCPDLRTVTRGQPVRSSESRPHQPPNHREQQASRHRNQPGNSDLPRKRKAPQPPAEPKPSPKRNKAEPPEEKRLKRWRPHPPQSYADIRERALTQRMFVVDRRRTTSDDQTHPIETATIVGTTGNVYTVRVAKVPRCDCPHARKGNQCKHLVYVLSRVLRAPPHLEYQLAFTASELVSIFEGAPPLPAEAAAADDGARDGSRRPIEGECPICCDEFGAGEEVVWCRAACGNNIHRQCFDQWAATSAGRGVTCPFCRAAWQADEGDPKAAIAQGRRNAEGYVNVAGAFGLSGRRDYSTYHDRWVSSQMREGLVDDQGYGYDRYE